MRKLRKVFALTLVLTMVMSLGLTGCKKDNGAGKEATETEAKTETGEGEETDIEKPEQITIMVDGTLVTKENGRDAFEAKWEELTGIDLKIVQPDHDAYYDVVGQTLASGEWPDVILLNSAYYSGYAEEGALWDMTDYWENSELKASGRINNEEIIDGLYMNGKLYGLSPFRGNGCVTYVKKTWLDNVGMNVPTTYDEYIKMLDVFTTGDPDKNGKDGDTYGVSSAGIIGEEEPYVNYLPEFYQDAYPSFYKNADGQWVDGFTEEPMIKALERLKDAYEKGYIDKESLTNGTSDCRNKFYEDKFGVFTYWAGTWATNMKMNLEANDLPGDLIPIEPIKEVGSYLERQAPVWCITSKAKNPEGVAKYFLETMLDGGEVQQLFTYGVEGTHWSTKAEEVCGNKYEEGQFHGLENLEKPGTQYTKNHIDPLLSISNFDKFEDPGAKEVAKETREAQELFNSHSRLVDLVPSTDVMSQFNGDLITLKREIIANVVTQGLSIDDEMKRFEEEGGAEWSKAIADSMNGK